MTSLTKDFAEARQGAYHIDACQMQLLDFPNCLYERNVIRVILVVDRAWALSWLYRLEGGWLRGGSSRFSRFRQETSRKGEVDDGLVLRTDFCPCIPANNKQIRLFSSRSL